MAKDVTKVKVGTCDVKAAGTDLGHTKGGVEISYEPSYHDIQVDEYGETVVNKKLLGEKFTAKVPLAEYTLANLAVAIPNSSIVGTTPQKLTFGSKAGKDMLSKAVAWVFHPIDAGASKAFDINIPKGVVTSTVTITHVNDAERAIEVTVEALLDETATDGAYLAFIGDPAAAA